MLDPDGKGARAVVYEYDPRDEAVFLAAVSAYNYIKKGA